LHSSIRMVGIKESPKRHRYGLYQRHIVWFIFTGSTEAVLDNRYNGNATGK
jgi:hypothetical protein